MIKDGELRQYALLKKHSMEVVQKFPSIIEKCPPDLRLNACLQRLRDQLEILQNSLTKIAQSEFEQ